MSEPDNQTVKVHDKRRFTPEGEPLGGPEVVEDVAPAQEPVSVSETEAAAVADAAKLRLELEAARKRVDELARGFQALDKDREDFKARLTRERERMIDVEKGNVAQTLLEAIDELELSLSASAQDESPLARGVRLIRENLLKKLGAMGIDRVSLLGEPYDPNLAEAIDMELTGDEAQDGRVTAELRAAFRMKDRVIRPGRVKVAKFVKPASA